MSRALRRTAAAVAVVLLALSACDGGDPEPGPGAKGGGSAAAEPAELSPDWSHETSRSGLVARVTPMTDGYLLLDDGLTALGTDGSVRWRQQPTDLCATSAPNEAGDVAFSHGRKCRSVSVVDGATGELRWTVRVPLVSKQYDSGAMQVALGAKAVTLVQFCGQVTRLAVDDGRKLGVIAPHDRKCANEADSDGRTLAVWHDPVDASTPDDHGTGWIPQTPGEGAFELYDVDSGELLWRRKTNRRGGDLAEGAVISSDPLVLALTEKGHTTLRLHSRTDPTPGAYVGWQLDAVAGSSFTALGVVDGVLVGSVAGGRPTPLTGPRLYAFDLTTGEQLWIRDVNPPVVSTLSTSVAGVDADGVVVATSASDGDGGRTWLARWDLRTGEDSGVIGVLPRQWSAVGLDGEAVLLGTGDSVARVPLRPADAEVAAPRADLAWRDGDVPAVPADCLAVGDPTLHLLGLDASRDLPTPLSCHWAESAEPSYSSRDLWVNVTIAAPTGDGDTGTTAEENAERTIRQLVDDPPGGGGIRTKLELGKAEQVAGLGDEAYAVSGARLSGSTGYDTAGYLAVRVRNVVVVARYAGGFDIPYRHAAPAPLAQVEEGLLRAARETLASYGLDLGPDPTLPADGDHTEVPDVCTLLDDDARGAGLTEKTAVTRKGYGPRVSSCAWSQTGDRADDLTVHAYAVEGSRLSGGDAVATAEAIHAASVHRGTRRVKDLADRADLFRDDATEAEDGYDHSRRELWVRDGNLLIDIEYARWGAGLGDGTEAEVVRLARKVLRASRG
ncbi:PQQ-binding-like beta-propeller repeat protein [Nocardioides humi]|uniref:Pyrrolo-quinoline quinone repeat domain-containing protein n=1 Tax=Nocardioides humi TaxID=449461 RepID=A0ABN2BY08_9ACTN|nr:PQQ-binding-like beta-propeller repeat protein [Nocardioides humi]